MADLSDDPIFREFDQSSELEIRMKHPGIIEKIKWIRSDDFVDYIFFNKDKKKTKIFRYLVFDENGNSSSKPTVTYNREGKSIIRFYEDGISIRSEKWVIEGKERLINDDGPCIVRYYRDGRRKVDEWHHGEPGEMWYYKTGALKKITVHIEEYKIGNHSTTYAFSKNGTIEKITYKLCGEYEHDYVIRHIIEFSDGIMSKEKWYNNEGLPREDGPAVIEYYTNGSKKRETWYVQGKPSENPIEYPMTDIPAISDIYSEIKNILKNKVYKKHLRYVSKCGRRKKLYNVRDLDIDNDHDDDRDMDKTETHSPVISESDDDHLSDSSDEGGYFRECYE